MSAVDFDINAQSRSDVGKGASRRLRREGKVPAVLYGAGKDAVSLALDHDEIFHHLEHEAFYSHILSVKVDGKAQKAVLKDVQRHPAKPKIQHVDFQRVSETDKIHMHVPLHFIGESRRADLPLDDRRRHQLSGQRPSRIHRSGCFRIGNGRLHSFVAHQTAARG